MKIGILTSGGDCPGLNAVIRGAVIKGDRIYGHQFLAIRDGFRGLVEDDIASLPRKEVRGLARQGGTILGTSRTSPFRDDNGGSERVKEVMARHQMDAIIAVGGEGTLTVARMLADDGIKIVGVPKTIDNDLSATDYTFGFDTAVSIATESIDRLRTTGESHHRCMVVEVMGRHVGWIALARGPGHRRPRRADPRGAGDDGPDRRVGDVGPRAAACADGRGGRGLPFGR